MPLQTAAVRAPSVARKRGTKSMLKKALILLALFGVSVPDSHAGTTGFTYGDYSVVNNTAVTLNGPELEDVSSGAGQIVLIGAGADAGRSLATWDIDILTVLQPDRVPPPYVEIFTSAVGMTVPGGFTLTMAQVGYIGGLMNYGNSNIGQDVRISPAVQLAIWSIEYGDSYTYSSAEPGLVSLAISLEMDAKAGLIPSFFAWEALIDPAQDNAVLATLVPEPGSVSLLLLGLCGVAVLRARRGWVAR
jgi:hypothetical protein